jgi:hypothetical protein
MSRILIASLFFLGACGGNDSDTGGAVCDEETPCARVGEVCREGQCVEALCANSSQCPMESYCSAGQCLPGCTDEGDCYPGWTCDTTQQACIEESCTDSQNDCAFREFCNVATGDCYDAGQQYCSFCNEDYECGEGNYCINHYCGVNCSGGQECPAGFECYPFGDSSGNIITYQCFTYCWLFEEDGRQKQPGTIALPPKGTVLPLDLLPDGGKSAGQGQSPESR